MLLSKSTQKAFFKGTHSFYFVCLLNGFDVGTLGHSSICGIQQAIGPLGETPALLHPELSQNGMRSKGNHSSCLPTETSCSACFTPPKSPY